MAEPVPGENGAGQKALEHQSEIARTLGRLEGQLSQLQQSVENMRERMEREHDDLGKRVDTVESRTHRQDKRLVLAACAVIASVGAGAGGEHLFRILTTLM